MNLDVPKIQMYPMRLKGISICFTMLKAALCGNYVNFGVCKLYGDETLENVLDVTTKLILTIPQSDLMVKSHAFAIVNKMSAVINYVPHLSFRFIQSCHNHISYCWRVWPKIICHFCQHSIRRFSCTSSRVYRKVWQLKV